MEGASCYSVKPKGRLAQQASTQLVQQVVGKADPECPHRFGKFSPPCLVAGSLLKRSLPFVPLVVSPQLRFDHSRMFAAQHTASTRSAIATYHDLQQTYEEPLL